MRYWEGHQTREATHAVVLPTVRLLHRMHYVILLCDPWWQQSTWTVLPVVEEPVAPTSCVTTCIIWQIIQCWALNVVNTVIGHCAESRANNTKHHLVLLLLFPGCQEHMLADEACQSLLINFKQWFVCEQKKKKNNINVKIVFFCKWMELNRLWAFFHSHESWALNNKVCILSGDGTHSRGPVSLLEILCLVSWSH